MTKLLATVSLKNFGVVKSSDSFYGHYKEKRELLKQKKIACNNLVNWCCKNHNDVARARTTSCQTYDEWLI